QPGAVAQRQPHQVSDRGAAARGVQPAEPLQMGDSRNQPEPGDFWPYYDDSGHTADSAVWIEVRFLAAYNVPPGCNVRIFGGFGMSRKDLILVVIFGLIGSGAV